MTPEQLRAEILAGLDRILGMSRLLVSDEQRRIAKAQRRFWAGAGAPVEFLLELYYEVAND